MHHVYAICFPFNEILLTVLEAEGYVHLKACWYHTTVEEVRQDPDSYTICTSTQSTEVDEPDDYMFIRKEDALSKDPRVSWTTYREVPSTLEAAIAISKITDETDKDQHFVLEADLYTLSEVPFGNKDQFVVCNRDNWYTDLDANGKPSMLSSRNLPAHKASPKEINEYYNNISLKK